MEAMGLILKRNTILIASGPSHDPERKHLFVVCTDRSQDGKHLLVPINKCRGTKPDETCILKEYEHKFLKEESYINYRKSRVEPGDKLSLGIKRKLFIPHVEVNGQVFLRISNGICLSPFTPFWVKKFAGCVDR
ncbi:hypothetical protein [Hohaiivirga grylli]